VCEATSLLAREDRQECMEAVFETWTDAARPEPRIVKVSGVRMRGALA
jgi:hypothetical protein